MTSEIRSGKGLRKMFDIGKWSDLMDEEQGEEEEQKSLSEESVDACEQPYSYEEEFIFESEEQEQEAEEEQFKQGEHEAEEEQFEQGGEEESDTFEETEDRNGMAPFSFVRSRSFDQGPMILSARDRIPDTLQLVSDITKLGKPSKDFRFLEMSRRGLEAGFNPAVVECLSEGGCYYLRGDRGLAGIFKPLDEEPGSPRHVGDVFSMMRNGVPSGKGYVREVAAYVLDHQGFAGVPPTALVRVYSKVWKSEDEKGEIQGLEYPVVDSMISGHSLSPGRMARNQVLLSRPSSLRARRGMHSRSMSVSTSNYLTERVQEEEVETKDEQEGSASAPASPSMSSLSLPSKLGSLQAYVSHHSSAEDVGFSLLPLDAVQKIGVFDIRILNLDRHGGNILLQTVERSTAMSPDSGCHGRYSRRSESFCGGNTGQHEIRLVPIDHGLCLPKISQLSRTSDSDTATDAESIVLEWMRWPQAKEPFLPEVVSYVENLDVEADIAQLQTALDGALEMEELVALRVSTHLLQTMVARGHNLYEIGRVIQSGLLMEIVDQANLSELLTATANQQHCFRAEEQTQCDAIHEFMNRFRDALETRCF